MEVVKAIIHKNDKRAVNKTIGILNPSTPTKYWILKLEIQSFWTVNGDSPILKDESKFIYRIAAKNNWTPVVPNA